MTTNTAETHTASVTPAPVQHHWIMTVQTDRGRQATTSGVIGVTSGRDTHESTYTEVLRAVREWIGTENVTVLFFTVSPNQL